MNVFRTIAFFMALLLGSTFARAAAAPLERAAAAEWSSTVGQLADGLAAGGNEARITLLLSEQFGIRTFDGKPATLGQTLATTSEASWYRPLAYDATPDMLASDFAGLALTDQTIDPAVRRYLTAANDSAIRNANATALKWIAHVLAPRSDQPVAVIVLHHAAKDRSTPGKVTIVLAAGERVSGKLFRVKRIAFGQFELPVISSK